ITDQGGRQAARQFTLIANGWGINGKDGGNSCNYHDGHQGSGYGLGQLREENQDEQAENKEWVNGEGDIEKLRQLSHKNQNGQGVHKAHHDAARDKAHELSDAQQGQDDLQQSGQQDRGNQVVQAILADYRCHHECDGAGGGRNHGGAATNHSEGHRHDERRKQAYLRIHTGDDGKGNRFRNQSERHHQASEDFPNQNFRSL